MGHLDTQMCHRDWHLISLKLSLSLRICVCPGYWMGTVSPVVEPSFHNNIVASPFWLAEVKLVYRR